MAQRYLSFVADRPFQLVRHLPKASKDGTVSTQILIVDDSNALRNLIRTCIEQNTDWEICGEAENGQVAVEKVRELHPDLVILDLAMPVMNGLDAARHISVIAPNTTMVLFTLHDSGQLSKDARAAGIADVLSKSRGGVDQLLLSLRVLIDQRSSHES